MNSSTEGLAAPVRRSLLADLVELLSSMRFAISLLCVIAIASVIGTVLTQNEPLPNYINQFGPFWADIFGKLSLYNVYSAWWFLLIMAFLVVSTTLCIIRNAPKFLRDVSSWRDHLREQSLRNFHHHSEWTSAQGSEQLAQETARRVTAEGFKVKLVPKDGAILLAAKRGAANKWGYIFAHSAIVVICVGGLLDSSLTIRLQQWLFDKEPFVGTGLIRDIAPKHRLGSGNPSFRGNIMIPEGSSGNTVIVPVGDGVLVQELPFSIQLKKFIVDFYSTGMPKLFASDVVVTDHATGKSFGATIKVNEPLLYDGYAVYQSSFEDGGSRLKLSGYAMKGAANVRFPTEGEVGKATSLAGGSLKYSIEWTDFRPFNIENLSANAGNEGRDVRGVNAKGLERHLGSAANTKKSKDLKNIGPSVQYKLRDQNGQAREFNNYMLPVQVDGDDYFLLGMRENPNEAFSFLRIPADDNGKLDEWMRLRAALMNPALREKAAQRYAANVQIDSASAQLRAQLAQSALRGLKVFAGDEKSGGFAAVAAFIGRMPKAEQEKAADIFIKILNGGMWELWQLARAQDGLPPAPADQKHGHFLQLATNALSDAFFYRAPVALQLEGFEEVKASVFQVTRSPGKVVVYFGCLLLVLGVFAMLYVRERRLWVWIRPQEGGGAHALMAMSTQRRTLDFDKEFERLKDRLPLPSQN